METVDLSFTIAIPALPIETIDYMVLYWLIGVYVTLFWLLSNIVKLARYFKYNTYLRLVRGTFFMAWMWPVLVVSVLKDIVVRK